MKKLLVLSLLFLAFISCRKAETKGRYFVFGVIWHNSVGDPTSLFLLKNGQLYPDNMEAFNKNMSFKKEKLSKAKCKLGKELEDKLPDFLKNGSSETFGCPGCADGPHYFIQIGKYSSVKTYHIDGTLSTQPEEIKDYVVLLHSALRQLW